MGRVTVFAIDDCPFCKKAKSILTKHGVEYYEINLSDYPQKRPDMLKAAKVLTVPQIFFNEHHVGGATELEELVNKGEFDALWAKTQEEPEPTSELLKRPDEPPAPKPKPSPRAAEAIKVGNAELGVIDVVLAVEKALGKSFKAKTLAEFFVSAHGADVAQGVEAGKQMLELGLIKPVDGNSKFRGDQIWFWLNRGEKPACLNSFRVWKDRVDEPMLLINNLKKTLGNVVGKHRDEEGLVDYVAVAEDRDFAVFEEASCELQGVDMTKMSAKTKLAFVINVYNTGITHAFAKIGAPSNGLQRSKFFPTVGYNIGGNFYSFDQLESGILRANRPGPGLHRSGPIPLKDPRLASILKPSEVDNRIHFALNCGAKSCPPVKKFTAEAVSEELDIVARAFFMQKENFSIEGDTVNLTKILQWYGKDFGANKAEVATAVATWVSDEDATKIRALVDSGKIQVKFNFYDWSNDSRRSRKPPSACSLM